MEEVTNYGWAEITKTYKQPDGTLIVEGRLGGETIDLDGQALSKKWLDTAVPEWMERGPAIRAMHQPISAGRGTKAVDTGEDWWITTKIVDPIEVMKTEAGLYGGFSVGIKNGRVVENAKYPNGLINGGKIVEVSLADAPCDPLNKLSVVEKTATIDAPSDEDVDKALDADVVKRDFSASDRKRLAGEGKALPDGSFPIANEEDLHNAVRLAGHATDKAAAKKHIIERARAMGLTSALPDDWTGDAKKMAFEEIVVLVAEDPELLQLLQKIVAPEKTKSAPSCACCHACTGGEGCPCTCAECVWNKGDASSVSPPTTQKADVSENNEPKTVAAPGTATDGAVDAHKVAVVDPVTPTEPDLTKFVTADSLKTVLADTMKASLAEAMQPLEARLAEMEKRAAPGGPAVVKRQFDAPEAIQKALLQKRADSMQALINHPDPRIAQDARVALGQLGQ